MARTKFMDLTAAALSLRWLQSVRIFVAISVEYDLDMEHMDVSTAFLYADIQEKVLTWNRHLASWSRTRMEAS